MGGSTEEYQINVVKGVENAPNWQLVIRDDGAGVLTEVTHKPSRKKFNSTDKIGAQRDVALMMNLESNAEARQALKLQYIKFLQWCKSERKRRTEREEKAAPLPPPKARAPKATAPTKAMPAASKAKAPTKAQAAAATKPAAVKAARPTPAAKEKPKPKAKATPTAKAAPAPAPAAPSPTAAKKSQSKAAAAAATAAAGAVKEPEPPKGRAGTHLRSVWNAWNERQHAGKKAELEAARAQAKLAAAAAAVEQIEALAAAKREATRRSKEQQGKGKPATAAAAARKVPLNSKAAQAKATTKDAGKETFVSSSSSSSSSSSLLGNDFVFATRAPSQTAKGTKRKVGKGKTSSAAPDQEPKTKKTRGDAGSAAMKLTGGTSSHAILAGAETLFLAQRVGCKGLREAGKKHSQRSSIVPSEADMKTFRRLLATRDPQTPARAAGLQQHLTAGSDWLWQLQLDFSLLLFGVGCKSKLLSSFANQFLSGEDVVAIDGSRVELGGTGTRTVRALLDTIAAAVLHLPALGAACLTLDSYAHCVKEALQRNYNRSTASSLAGATMAGAGLSRSNSSNNLPDSATRGTQAGLPPRPPLPTVEEDEEQGSISAPPGPAPADDSNAFHWGATTFGGGGDVRLSRTASASSLEALEVGDVDPNWGGRFTQAKAKLYVLVHAIDGEALQSKEAQGVLAALAACPSISLVASCDKVNAPLLWSNDLLTQFRWSFQHTPTYDSYSVPSRFAMLKGQKGMVSHNQGLEYILGSLTNRHKELLTLLAKERLKAAAALQAQDDGTGAGNGGAYHTKGMGFDELLAVASKAMVVQQSNALHTYLKELEDHRLVSVSTDSHKKKYVRIMLQHETLIKLTSITA